MRYAEGLLSAKGPPGQVAQGAGKPQMPWLLQATCSGGQVRWLSPLCRQMSAADCAGPELPPAPQGTPGFPWAAPLMLFLHPVPSWKVREAKEGTGEGQTAQALTPAPGQVT